jgi:hypothetical protein
MSLDFPNPELFSGFHQFGIMLAEYRRQRSRRALFHRMNVLNQLEDIGGPPGFQ